MKIGSRKCIFEFQQQLHHSIIYRVNSRRSLIKQVFGPGTEFDTKYLNAPNTGDKKKIFMLIRKMYILFPAAFTKHCAMYFSFFIAFQIVNWSKVAANKICDVKKPKISFIFPQQITILLKYIHMMTLIN